MKTIQLNGHTKPDGALDISVPTGMPDLDVEVLLVVQPVRDDDGAGDRGWPPGFFERTAGQWQGNALTRGEQGNYEDRERLPLAVS